ncbi:MAG: histidine phosphatase family protein [Elusimicrobia bacterium]|nr:histidine phosphatase family protein [Elusimicrobiota bacterium]
MRHGHAPSITEAGVTRDYDRPLSEQGRAAVKRMAAYLVEEGAKPSVILHSPLKRAVQTAETAAALLKPPPAKQAFEPLSNLLPPEPLLEKLKPELARHDEVLAVGHQPQLGELAAHLAGRIFELKPGGLIALDLGGETAKVLWSCNPQDIPVR